MTDVQKPSYLKVALSLIFSLLATVTVIYIGFKGIFFFMPLVIAWGIALAVSPVVKWLENRLKIVRKLGSAITILMVIGAVLVGIYAICVELWELCSRYMADFPELYRTISTEIEYAVEKLNIFFDKLPEPVQITWDSLVNQLGVLFSEGISKLSQPTMSAASSVARSIPSILVSSIISIIACYFFVADRESILQWLNRVTPNPIKKRMKLVNHQFKYAVGGYFKAQLKIMMVVFLVLFIALSFLGVRNAILVAMGIAILDFFPVFGTGTALLPWAVFRLIISDYKMTICLLILYVVTQGMRQFIQPKMVADSVEMNPVLALILLYSGYQLYGVVGMIVAVPIGLILVNLYEAGAMDYILDDIKVLRDGVIKLGEESKKFQEK